MPASQATTHFDNVLTAQPQQQQHPLEPRTIGAQTTYEVTKIRNLSHFRLDLRCSFGSGCMVTPAQCQVTDALHAALHCTLQQHPHPHTTNLPAHTPVHTYLHYEDYICNAHAICAGTHPPIQVCSHICMTLFGADAV